MRVGNEAARGARSWAVWFPAVGIVLLGGLVERAAGAADPVRLREQARVGEATRVTIVLSAEGTRPGIAASGTVRAAQGGGGGGADAQAKAEAKPTGEPDLPFRVEVHCDFDERVLTLAADGRPGRLVRRVERATAEIDFFRAKGQKMAVRLRPELELLVTERRPEGPITVSVGGPLSRSELDVLQGPGEPLSLASLLPEKPVAVGDTWSIPGDAARALSEYEALAANTLKGRLLTLEEGTATIGLSGEVRGAVRGGEGVIRFDGQAVFDRQAGRVQSLRLDRNESRAAGQVESAVEARSRLEVARTPIAVPEALSDAALKDLPLEVDARRALLQLVPPDGRYELLHDRDWHLAFEDTREVVLKRFDRGEFLAQCNLRTAPAAGVGRHQDLNQFRDELKQSLGKFFGAFGGMGEVGGAAAGGFRYKVAVEGAVQDNGVQPVWYYYLVAAPSGEQIIGIFTLSKASEARFGDQDLQVIGTLEWREAAAPAPAPGR